MESSVGWLPFESARLPVLSYLRIVVFGVQQGAGLARKTSLDEPPRAAGRFETGRGREALRC